MTNHHAIDRYLTRFPAVSAGLYLALIVILALTAFLMLMDTMESYQARNASLEQLGRMQERGQRASGQPNLNREWPPGSPLLEGSTVTVAGAALLQRVSSAVTQLGGNLVSSELESLESVPKDDALKATANFEIEQNALAKVLYNLEAGMPFLFVDQLVVSASPSDEGGKMRVMVQVSGRWSGAK
jgi:general secretion pathway protein M